MSHLKRHIEYDGTYEPSKRYRLDEVTHPIPGKPFIIGELRYAEQSLEEKIEYPPFDDPVALSNDTPIDNAETDNEETSKNVILKINPETIYMIPNIDSPNENIDKIMMIPNVMAYVNAMVNIREIILQKIKKIYETWVRLPYTTEHKIDIKDDIDVLLDEIKKIKILMIKTFNKVILNGHQIIDKVPAVSLMCKRIVVCNELNNLETIAKQYNDPSSSRKLIDIFAKIINSLRNIMIHVTFDSSDLDIDTVKKLAEGTLFYL